jgi:hypothetical protein
VNKEREHKPGPGRRRPPGAHLVGRTEACRILGIGKRKLVELGKQHVLPPPLVEPGGVSWYERAAVEKLAATMKKSRLRKTRRSSRPEGVERVSGAQARQITEWLLAGLTVPEIVLRSGKSYETIHHVQRLFRSAQPGAESYDGDEPGYYPELEPVAGQPPTRRPTPAPEQPKGPVKAPRALTPVPAHWFDGAPADSRTPRRAVAAAAATQAHAKTQVPDAWFTGELPSVEDEDDGEREAP